MAPERSGAYLDLVLSRRTKQPNSTPGKKPAALNAAHGDCLAKLWCGPGPRPKGEITAKGRGRAQPACADGRAHWSHWQELRLADSAPSLHAVNPDARVATSSR